MGYPLRNFQQRGAFITPVPMQEWKMIIQKCSLHHLATGSILFIAPLTITVNKRKLLELLLVRCCQWVFWLPLVVRGGAKSLKGSHRLGDRLIFLKTSSMPYSLKTTYRLNRFQPDQSRWTVPLKEAVFTTPHLREVCAHLNSTRCRVTHFSSIQFLLHHACTVQWPWMELDGVYT
jgi:hypothetical protein